MSRPEGETNDTATTAVDTNTTADIDTASTREGQLEVDPSYKYDDPEDLPPWIKKKIAAGDFIEGRDYRSLKDVIDKEKRSDSKSKNSSSNDGESSTNMVASWFKALLGGSKDNDSTNSKSASKAPTSSSAPSNPDEGAPGGAKW